MASKQVDPLKFAYVKVTWTDADKESPETFKIFHVDDTKIRMRRIKMEHGQEVEGDNLWVPWQSIYILREINAA